MAGTTTNGLPYPESTDFVTDGAQAIEDLAVAVDAKMGLWKITPSSVSGTGASINSTGNIVCSSVSSVTINGAFPTNFQNFKMILSNIVGSGSDNIMRLQLRDTSTITTNYRSSGIYRLYAGGSGDLPSYTTFFSVGNAISTGRTNTVLDIFNPNQSTITGVVRQTSNYDAYVTESAQNTNTSGYQNCVIFPAGGTFSGIISIYGYN